MAKIAMIGAGSIVFCKTLMNDLLSTPALKGSHYALMSRTWPKLEKMKNFIQRVIDENSLDASVSATLDRKEALQDADYVVVMIQVGGLDAFRHDYEIPMKYGVDQCIGDTIGPGGLFKALRTLPTWIDILHDTERLAPDALVMNYTNPMSLTVLTGVRASTLPIVGLCHSIQHTSHQLAGYLDIPYDEIDWRSAGINHLAWFVKLERDGEDLYPLLRQRIAEHPEIYEQDPVRFDMMVHLGAFPTESSGHVSEYTAYYRKRPDLIEKYTRSEYRGESGFYANFWPQEREEASREIRDYLSGKEAFEFERGAEFASYIMEAMVTDVPAVIYGNVLNTGLIDNLPQDGVVEVACLVDRKGIQPTHFGPLPTHLANLGAQHMAFHDLVATAVLEQDREAAIHALMTDPLTAAVCSLEEARRMFDEMVEVEKAYLPEFLYA